MVISPEILIFLLAMMPISELRGAIPMGILVFNLSFWKVFLISFLGNLIPVFFLLLFLEPVSNFLSKKSKFFKKNINWLFERTRKKVDSHIRKYEEIGLVIFVAIPFPLTGGWSGAIAAFLFGLPFKVAFPLVSFGILIAGIIVSILTISGIAVEKYFGWATFFGIIILILFFWFFYRFFKKRVKKNFKNNH